MDILSALFVVLMATAALAAPIDNVQQKDVVVLKYENDNGSSDGAYKFA